jgi:predicted nucleotidyltransferase/HEPN domain-containing protein
MKKDLDHLPRRKQRDLERIVAILHEEFDDALKFATMEKRTRGRILKIVLFGSYARGDWVDGFSSNRGYQSDYDILIVVNQHKLTDEAAIWYKAEDRFTRAIREPVTLIVHTLAEVNDQMAKGHYFFADIRREGIMLYELAGQKPLAKPRALNAQQAYDVAKEHFDQRFPRAAAFLPHYQLDRDRGDPNLAAFMLHQAVEHAYHALLLTLTHYTPNSHNIVNLRNLAEARDRRLIEAWPRYFKRDRATYNLLKRAYVEARYSPHFAITTEQLDWLEAGTRRLHTLVEQACEERLEELRARLIG